MLKTNIFIVGKVPEYFLKPQIADDQWNKSIGCESNIINVIENVK